MLAYHAMVIVVAWGWQCKSSRPDAFVAVSGQCLMSWRGISNEKNDHVRQEVVVTGDKLVAFGFCTETRQVGILESVRHQRH